MMNDQRVISVLVVLAVLTSCSSLEKSTADRVMRFEGSYGCDKVSIEPPNRHESLAEADVSRVRCYQDSWAFRGEQVVFTRTLFQSKQCDGPLGKIQFETPTQNIAEKGNGGMRIQDPQCQVVRTNISWLGERSGACMLKDLKVNQPYSVRGKCNLFLPVFCKTNPITVDLMADPGEWSSPVRSPFSQIQYRVTTSSPQGVCKRYVGN